MPAKAPTCELPRPWRPATPMWIVSFAPKTRPDDLVPATVTVAAAARVFLIKLRRFRDMAGPFAWRDRELDTLQIYPRERRDARKMFNPEPTATADRRRRWLRVKQWCALLRS